MQMTHAFAEGLDYTSRFNARHHWLGNPAAFIPSIAPHPNITKIYPADSDANPHLSSLGKRVWDFQYTQDFRGANFGKSYGTHRLFSVVRGWS
jgi:hypothetical protein